MAVVIIIIIINIINIIVIILSIIITIIWSLSLSLLLFLEKEMYKSENGSNQFINFNLVMICIHRISGSGQ